MPALYLAIKAAAKRKGKSEKESETIAAKAYNAQRPAGTPPVTKNYEESFKNGKTKKRSDRGNSSSEY